MLTIVQKQGIQNQRKNGKYLMSKRKYDKKSGPKIKEIYDDKSW